MLDMLKSDDPLPGLPFGDDPKRNLMWVFVGMRSNTLDYPKEQCFDNVEGAFFTGQIVQEARKCRRCFDQAGLHYRLSLCV